jgi:hypothetical protein
LTGRPDWQGGDRPPEHVEQLPATRREGIRFVIDHAEIGKDAHDIAEPIPAVTRPDKHARRPENTPIRKETQGAFQAVPHLPQGRVEVRLDCYPINDGDQQIVNSLI